MRGLWALKKVIGQPLLREIILRSARGGAQCGVIFGHGIRLAFISASSVSLGVLVALTRDPTEIGRREKAVWIFVMFALLMLEIKSVYQDRNEHDKQQAEARERETRSFEGIADGIKREIRQSHEQFEATMQKSDAIMAGVADSVRFQNGGDSFAYITFTPEQAYAHSGKKTLFANRFPAVQVATAQARIFWLP